MVIDSKLRKEYDAFSREHFYRNDNIYEYMDNHQLDAISKYFRWRTAQRFRELVRDTTLEVKPKKAEKLAGIMGNATDWQYDGCIDTGFVGNGHCALGHALRYEHYAVSPSLGREIIFGVTCASDFFGIEPDKLRKINGVQDEIQEEIKLISFILQTDKHEAYKNRYYKDLYKVIEVLKNTSGVSDAFGSGWNTNMGRFLAAGLPFTESMVDRYNEVLTGIYPFKLAEYRKAKAIQEIAAVDPKVAEFLSTNSTAEKLYIVKSILEALFNNEIGENDTRRAPLLRLCMLFTTTYEKLEGYGAGDIYKIAQSTKASILHMRKGDKVRLATKKEVELGAPGLFSRDIILIDDKNYRMLHLFAWGVYGDEVLFKESKCSELGTVLTRIIKSGRFMAETLDWLNNPNELKSTMEQLKEKMEEYAYPDTADDEELDDLSLSARELCQFIEAKGERDPENIVLKIAKDIAARSLQYNNYDVSPKQLAKLREAYAIYTAKTSKKQTESKAKANSGIPEDLKKKIDAIVKEKNNKLIQYKISFALKIIETVMKYKKASEKQLKVIDEAYELVLRNSGESGQIAMPGMGMFQDKKHIKDDSKDDTEEMDSDQVFSGAPIKTSGQVWGTGKANSAIQMPSISVISHELGKGSLVDQGE